MTTCLVCLAWTDPSLGAPPATDSDAGYVTERVSLQQLSAELETGAYVPIARQAFVALMRRLADPKLHPTAPRRPLIRVAKYSASVDGQTLTNGKLSFELDAAPSITDPPLWVLGLTNLEQLSLLSGDQAVSTVALASGELATLTLPAGNRFNGEWRLAGRAEQTETRFDLQLPPAVLTSLLLTTNSTMHMTSSNAQVTLSEETPTQLTWLVHPRNPRELSLVCSSSTTDVESDHAAPISLRSDFLCADDEVLATWTIGITEQLADGRLVFESSAPCQVTEALLTDGTSLTTKTDSDKPTRIELFVPQLSRASTLTIRGRSSLRIGQPTAVPLLVPQRHYGRQSGRAASIGISQSQIQILIPAFLTVRGLALIGAQQRDVSFANDGSQMLQLTQFESDANVSVTLDRARPLLQQDLLFQLAPEQDRNSVRVHARVTSLTGSAAELVWRVPNEWRATEVRDVRSVVPLFFETRKVPNDESSTELVVHLRTPVTPAADAQIAIRLQSTRFSAVAPATIPQLENADYRQGKVVYAAPRSVIWQTFPESHFTARPADDGVPAAFDWLPGDIKPESTDLFLLNSNTLPIAAGRIDAVSENDRPHERDISLPIATAESVDQQSTQSPVTAEQEMIPESKAHVSGTVFTILTGSGGHVHLENFTSLNVASARGRGSLQFRVPEAASVEAAVNGRPALVRSDGDWLSLLIPDSGALTAVSLRWTSTIPQSLFAGARVDVSPIRLNENATSSICRRILLPDGHSPQSEALSTGTGLLFVDQSSLTETAARLLPDQQRATHDQVAGALARFRSHWLMNSHTDALLCTVAPAESHFGTVTIFGPRLRAVLIASGTLIAATLLLLTGLFSPAHKLRLFLFLSVAVIARCFLPSPWRIAADTLTVWFGVAASVSVLQFLSSGAVRTRLLSRHQFGKPQAIASALIVGCLIIPASLGDEGYALRPRILVPDFAHEDFPFVYVPRELVAANDPPVMGSVCVERLEVDLSLQHDGSAVASIRGRIARPVGTAPAMLLLPLHEATLTHCRIDRQQASPLLNEAGQISVPVSNVSVIEPRPLRESADSDPVGLSARPEDGERWTYHQLDYQIRLRQQQAGNSVRVHIPLPASPETDIALRSPDFGISQATVRSRLLHRAQQSDGGVLQIPRLYNTGSLEIAAQTATTFNVEEPLADVSLTCIAEVRPYQTIVRCNYESSNERTFAEAVSIGLPKGFHVTGVRDADGTQLSWSLRDTRITLGNQFAEDVLRRFVVVLTSDSRSPSLTQTINMSELVNVTNHRCRDITLAVRTVAPFVLSGVRSDGQLQNDVPVSDQTRDELLLRAADRTFNVPVTASTVIFELAEQTVTREARLIQQASVTSSSVNWRCRCELEVSGALIFRQNIRLDESVELKSVTATAAETNRLQSYSFSDGLLTVTFREATRGVVRIAIDGNIRVGHSGSVTLPVIDLPDAEILESSLLLNSGEATRAYISDLAGAVPDSPIVIEDAPLTEEPVRMTITEESRPLSLHLEAVTVPRADVFVVTNEAAGLATAHLVLMFSDLRRADPMRVDLSGSAFADTQPAVIASGTRQPSRLQDGRISIRAAHSEDETEESEHDAPTVLILPNIRLRRDSDGVLNCPLPILDSDVRFGAATVLGPLSLPARTGDRASQTDGDLVDTVSDAFAVAGLPLQKMPRIIVPAVFDSLKQCVRFNAAEEHGDPKQARTVGYAVVATLVRVTGTPGIGGTSQFLMCHRTDVSGFDIVIPKPLQIVGVVVDGSRIEASGERVHVPVNADPVMTLVEIEWLAPGDGASLLPRHLNLPLPSVRHASQDDFVNIQSGPGVHATLQSVTHALTEGEVRIALRDRMIAGLDFIKANQTPDTEIRMHATDLLPSEFAGFTIEHQPTDDRSDEAAWDLQQNHAAAMDTLSLVRGTGSVAVAVRRTLRPLEAFGAISLATLAMTLVIGWKRTRAESLVTAAAEASTVISQDSAMIDALSDTNEPTSTDS